MNINFKKIYAGTYWNVFNKCPNIARLIAYIRLTIISNQVIWNQYLVYQ